VEVPEVVGCQVHRGGLGCSGADRPPAVVREWLPDLVDEQRPLMRERGQVGGQGVDDDLTDRDDSSRRLRLERTERAVLATLAPPGDRVVAEPQRMGSPGLLDPAERVHRSGSRRGLALKPRNHPKGWPS